MSLELKFIIANLQEQLKAERDSNKKERNIMEATRNKLEAERDALEQECADLQLKMNDTRLKLLWSMSESEDRAAAIKRLRQRLQEARKPKPTESERIRQELNKHFPEANLCLIKSFFL